MSCKPGRLVNAYLDMAKDMAERHIPMTMEDWAKRIDSNSSMQPTEKFCKTQDTCCRVCKEYAESEFEI